MRICMLTTAFPRYKGDLYLNFVLELSKSLIKKNIQIKVITPNDSTSKSFEVVNHIQINRFTYMIPERLQQVAYKDGIIRNLNNSILAKIELPFFFFFFFLESLKQSMDCDIIHAHTSLPAFIGVLLKKIAGKRLTVTLHGTEIDMLKAGIIKKMTLWVLRNSDRIITVSNSLKQKTVRMGIPKNKIEVIPDGVNLSDFKYHKEEKNIDIIFIGRLSKEKGLPVLLKAVRKLIGGSYSLNLFIIGKGDNEEKLKKLVKTLRMENNVSFRGEIPHHQLLPLLQRAKILVLPSLREGFGMVLLEAMASGTSVIGSNVGGIPDIIRDKENGLLFRKGDAKDLAKKILILLENPNLRKKFAIKARKTVEENFTWDKVAKRTIKVYGEVYNEKR